MKKNTYLKVIILMFFASYLNAQDSMTLEGKWKVQLDTDKKGIIKDNFLPITLPGTLTEAEYGNRTEGSDFGILTSTYKYIGVAWYQREIDIPKTWKNKNIEIFLERVLWESRVFIDGKELSMQDALGTAHVHKIRRLSPGKHILTIRIDNDMVHDIGNKGHAYG